MENYSCVTFGMQNPVGTTFEYYINVFKSGASKWLEFMIVNLNLTAASFLEWVSLDSSVWIKNSDDH